MTSRATKAPLVTEEATAVEESPAPKKWGVCNLLGRDIEFNAPNPEQLMVLRRLSRQLDDANATSSKKLIVMAKILDAVSACMVDDDTVDYVDNLVLDRKIGAEELVPLILTALVGDEGVKKNAAPKTGPVRRVRRR